MINTIRAKLKEKRGEMLIETIIAIALFALVMVAVSSLITISFNLLKGASEQYSEVEEYCRQIEAGEVTGSTMVSLQYQMQAPTAEQPSEAQIVALNEDHPIIFFEPQAK